MKDDAISFKALFSRFTGALSMSGRHLALHLIHAKANKADTRDPVRQAANDDRGTRTLVSHAPSEMTPPTRNGAEDKESTSSRQNKPLSREPGAGPPRLATNKRSAAVPLGALHQERIEPAHVHIAVPHIVRAFSIELQSGRSSCEGIAVVRTQSRRDGPNCCLRGRRRTHHWLEPLRHAEMDG